MTVIRSVARALQRRLDPRAAAHLGSIYLTVRARTRCTVRYADGVYVHRYRDGVIVDTTLGGPTPQAQDRDARDTFLYGYEPRPGDTVVDIGAGVGGEARLFSRLVGARGRVVSIEAHPRTFRCLTHTTRMNGLTNVTTLHCAVVGRPGSVFLEDRGDGHIGNALTTDRASAVSVPGRTLDDVMAALRLDRIHLLKMNIEGAELAVLDGSPRALRRVEHLVVSCHDFLANSPNVEGVPHGDAKRTFGAVTALLRASGYAVRTRPDDARPWIPFYVYASRERP